MTQRDMSERTDAYYRRKFAALARLERMRLECWPRSAKRRLVLLSKLHRSPR